MDWLEAERKKIDDELVVRASAECSSDLDAAFARYRNSVSGRSKACDSDPRVAHKVRRLPSVKSFLDLNQELDRVERRDDRVFLVDLGERYSEPELEVLPEEITEFEGWKAVMAQLNLDQLAGWARNIAAEVRLSSEGRRERLAFIRQQVLDRFPAGLLR